MKINLCVAVLMVSCLCPHVLAQTDYESDRKRWEHKAEKGDATAQYRLAGFYDNGWGVAVNHKIDAEWHRRSAEQGHTDAQYNLGLMCLSALV